MNKVAEKVKHSFIVNIWIVSLWIIWLSFKKNEIVFNFPVAFCIRSDARLLVDVRMKLTSFFTVQYKLEVKCGYDDENITQYSY
jgi:hypothetical protein